MNNIDQIDQSFSGFKECIDSYFTTLTNRKDNLEQYVMRIESQRNLNNNLVEDKQKELDKLQDLLEEIDGLVLATNDISKTFKPVLIQAENYIVYNEFKNKGVENDDE